MKRYAPCTPGGSVLMHLVAESKAEAWKKLMEDAKHMPYKTKVDFIWRGYTVVELVDRKSLPV